MKIIIYLSFLVIGLVWSPVSGAAAQQKNAQVNSSIEWSGWDEAAFRRATTEDKLILLDLTV